MRRATASLRQAFATQGTFQSTLSMRRATGNRRAGDWHDEISIHALHEESDEYASFLLHFHFLFQSTLSMRRATGRNRQAIHQPRISIHALHEESDIHVRRNVTRIGSISIHALHEESDRGERLLRILRGISIHALHEESDRQSYSIAPSDCYFNPRSP